MLRIIKNNKLLSIIVIDTIIFILIGFIIGILLNNKTSSSIYSNLMAYIKELSINNNYLQIFVNIGLNNIILLLLYWIFRISIIGILLLGIIYSYQILIFSLEIYVLFNNLNSIPFTFLLFYLISSILIMILFFIQVYYSCSYSIILYKYLFRRGEYPLKIITKRYLRIGFLLLICLIITIIIKIFLLYFLYPILS